jgi:hypothetical protein
MSRVVLVRAARDWLVEGEDVGAAEATAAGWLITALVGWPPKMLAQTIASIAKSDLNI